MKHEHIVSLTSMYGSTEKPATAENKKEMFPVGVVFEQTIAGVGRSTTYLTSTKSPSPLRLTCSLKAAISHATLLSLCSEDTARSSKQ